MGGFKLKKVTYTVSWRCTWELIIELNFQKNVSTYVAHNSCLIFGILSLETEYLILNTNVRIRHLIPTLTEDIFSHLHLLHRLPVLQLFNPLWREQRYEDRECDEDVVHGVGGVVSAPGRDVADEARVAEAVQWGEVVHLEGGIKWWLVNECCVLW